MSFWSCVDVEALVKDAEFHGAALVKKRERRIP